MRTFSQAGINTTPFWKSKQPFLARWCRQFWEGNSERGTAQGSKNSPAFLALICLSSLRGGVIPTLYYFLRFTARYQQRANFICKKALEFSLTHLAHTLKNLNNQLKKGMLCVIQACRKSWGRNWPDWVPDNKRAEGANSGVLQRQHLRVKKAYFCVQKRRT